MADKTKILWADATLNPAYGCSKVSPACDNCYAARMADRMAHNVQVCQYFEGLTDKNHEWTGRVNLFPERMEQALKWMRPRRIFVGSMTDLFHEDVPVDFLDQVFAVMAMACQHTFMILTKRPDRMRQYIKGVQGVPIDSPRDFVLFDSWRAVHGEHYGQRLWPLPNVWLGVTVENQAMDDARIPILLDTPAAKRFVSIEPMLGTVDLGHHLTSCFGCGNQGSTEMCLNRPGSGHDLCRACGKGDNPNGLDWVICGGETGPGARPLRPDWARGLRDQCAAADVPFMFKQWGDFGPCPGTDCGFYDRSCATRERVFEVGEGHMCRVGKRVAGRMLDGVEHNGIPEIKA
jgi:protein gp37